PLCVIPPLLCVFFFPPSPLFSPSPLSFCVLPFFFFTATATPEIYTLSLHDALPILVRKLVSMPPSQRAFTKCMPQRSASSRMDSDRKSTRLNSSHVSISYAVFCLKKKKKKNARAIYGDETPQS